jgi:hypothetical protein
MVPTFNFCAGRASDRRHGRQCEGASTTIPEHLCMSFSSLFLSFPILLFKEFQQKNALDPYLAHARLISCLLFFVSKSVDGWHTICFLPN